MPLSDLYLLCALCVPLQVTTDCVVEVIEMNKKKKHRKQSMGEDLDPDIELNPVSRVCCTSRLQYNDSTLQWRTICTHHTHSLSFHTGRDRQD